MLGWPRVWYPCTFRGVPVNRERIKQLRTEKGLSLQAAADKAGMKGRAHWHNIESGAQKDSGISIELLERVASALGVKVVDLIDR